jgi:molecular chaperone GrpE
MSDEKDDVTFDMDSDIDDSVVAEEAQGETIKKLREKLKAAEAKAKENMDGWQRAQADFSNLRKRDEEAKGEFLKFANANFIKEIIPVLDSFTLAIAHGEKGIEPIYNQLWQILKASGLEESNPLGEMFDPNFHEAIAMVKTDKQSDDHKILDVLQKGYILSGKSIRPAKVRIGEFSN